MYKDDEDIIYFSSTDLHQVIDEFLNQRMQEYLAESELLFKYNMRKLMCTDKQIKKVENKLERESDMERFNQAWER